MKLEKLATQKILNSYPLLLDLSKASPIKNVGVEVGPGWYPLVYETLGLLNDLALRYQSGPHVNQIKMESGALEVLSSNSNPDLEQTLIEIISRYLSGEICEVCGATGVRQHLSFGYHTRCERHSYLRNDVEYNIYKYKVFENFINSDRQGLKTDGFAYVHVYKSPYYKNRGCVHIYEFPEHLLSLKESMEYQLHSICHDDVNDLIANEIIHSVNNESKAVIFAGDGSRFAKKSLNIK